VRGATVISGETGAKAEEGGELGQAEAIAEVMDHSRANVAHKALDTVAALPFICPGA
jgi:hypothetical protein